jgi:hypothetical protein
MKDRLVFENLGFGSIHARHLYVDPPLGPRYMLAMDSLPLLVLCAFVADRSLPLHRSGGSRGRWGRWRGLGGLVVSSSNHISLAFIGGCVGLPLLVIMKLH